MTGSIVTQEEVTLDLYADEALWTGRFDKLEVWRSRVDGAGPYEPLFSDAPSAARVPPGADGGPSGGPGKTLALSGLTLTLRVGETTDVVTVFDGPDPITLAEAAAEIAFSEPGLLTGFVLADGTLVIETDLVGPTAILRVVGGDAAPLLGLSTEEPDSVGFGRGVRIALTPGHSRYAFTDLNGSRTFFYRTRYFNSSTFETSEFGQPLRVPPIGGLSPSALIRGTLDLVGPGGTPIAHVAILVSVRFDGRAIEGKALAGGSWWKATDERGHVEFMLPRGVAVTVAVSGTDLARDLVVPIDPLVETFSLLDPAIGKDDLFVVQRPNLPFASRRSL